MSVSRLGFTGAFHEVGEQPPPQIVAVIPPNDSTAYSDFPPITQAIVEAREHRERRLRPDPTAAVYVVNDKDIHDEVLELLGKGVAVTVNCRVFLPILVLHVKDLGKLFDVEVSIIDNKAKLRHILLSNRVTTIRISDDNVALPLQLVPGWNHIPVNIADVTSIAFKTEFMECTSLVFHSSMRLAHAYFEDREYSDSQLPLFLRTIKVHT